VNIAICDDSRFNTVPLEEQLKELAAESNVEIFTDVYKSYSHLQTAMKMKKYDLLILAITLRGTSGIDFARGLRQQHNDVPVIFISDNADGALASFAVIPVGYILMPPVKRRLRVPFRYVAERIKGKDLLIFHGLDGERFTVDADDIRYLEVIGSELFVYTRTDVIKCFGTSLAETYEKLSHERFYRCHRSFIVNLDFVVKSAKYYFVMETGEKVTIAKNRYAEAKEKLSSYAGK